MTGPVFVYGFDPLCGWCYGAAPAVRAVVDAFPDLPVRLEMAGLVTGDRVGPYSEMEGYIRSASARLRAATGRAPTEAFFRLIATPGVVGDSAPPATAIVHVARHASGREVGFAHRLIEAHFETGADLNLAGTYQRLFSEEGLDLPPLDLGDRGPVEAAWARGRALGIARFPTFALERGGALEILETEYRPEALVAAVASRV